jgi:Tfp pilus assembly protein PilZ
MVKKDTRKVSRLNMARYYALMCKLIPNTNFFLPTGFTVDLKESAFRQAKLLNQKETTGSVWRVGITQSKKLVIDIDSHDTDNCNKVRLFYEELFGYRFNVIYTNNGFWLIGKHEYTNIRNWLYDNCRLLNPELKICEFKTYKEGLLSIDSKDNMATDELLRPSKYFNGVGKFDLIFVFINIKREKCTLRISKKHESDKIELLI